MSKQSLACKFDRFTITAVYCLFGVMMGCILILCLFFSNIDYACRIPYNNLLLVLPGSAAVLMLATSAQALTQRVSNRRPLVFIWVLLSLLFCIAQFWIINHYYFYTGWDAQMIRQCAFAIANGEDMGVYNYYFSTYPNNLLLVYIFSLLIRLCNSFGLSAYAYQTLIFLQCVLCWITGLLTASIGYRLTKKVGIALLAQILYLLLIGLSPWFSIPYSDAIVLIFPAAIYRVYLQPVKSGKSAAIKWFCIAALSLIGYHIKPQALIVTIAIALLQFFKLFRGISRKALLQSGAAIGLGICCSAVLVLGCTKLTGIQINNELTFGISHFLMMGLNTDAKGVWAEEDVIFSASAETAEQRNQQNLERVTQRLQDMGLSGFLQQLARKTLTNYNDGTFFWGGEGGFYPELSPHDNALSTFLLDIYHTETGQYYPVFRNFAQLLWLGILIMGLAALFTKPDTELAVLMLSIIGLTLFQGLFEARARYLLLYTPFYILLASIGVERTFGFFRNKSKK